MGLPWIIQWAQDNQKGPCINRETEDHSQRERIKGQLRSERREDIYSPGFDDKGRGHEPMQAT